MILPDQSGLLSVSQQQTSVASQRSKYIVRQIAYSFQLIAIAAYYRAAQFGYEDGCEVQDWLEAEAEIDGVQQSGRF